MQAGEPRFTHQLRHNARTLVGEFLAAVRPTLMRYLGIGIAGRYHFLAGQRSLLLKELDIVHVLDVGANVGQYGKELRQLGYEGRIHSFEPGKEAFKFLCTATQGDSNWSVYNCALSDHTGSEKLHNWTGAKSTLASLRSPEHSIILYAGRPDEEIVEVMMLKDWLRDRDIDLDRTLLKTDVQGSERQVLVGAGDYLSRFAMVELEAAIRSSYSGEALLPELLEFIDRCGMACVSVTTERFVTDWLRAVDVDVLAVRGDLLTALCNN